MRIAINGWFGGYPPGSQFDVARIIPGERGTEKVDCYLAMTGLHHDVELHIPFDRADMIDTGSSLKEAEREALFEFLKHGDEEHQDWLREAIDAFFFKLPRPPVRGSNG